MPRLRRKDSSAASRSAGTVTNTMLVCGPSTLSASTRRRHRPAAGHRPAAARWRGPRQPRHVVLERVDAGGGEHAGLAQTAAEHLARTDCAVDELARAEQHAAHRRAQPLLRHTDTESKPAAISRGATPVRSPR